MYFGAEGREQRAESREQRAGSREQRAGSREQGAGSRGQKADRPAGQASHIGRRGELDRLDRSRTDEGSGDGRI